MKTIQITYRPAIFEGLTKLYQANTRSRSRDGGFKQDI